MKTATQNINEKTFHNGAFLLGAPVERDVVEEDYACEYSLESYLAHATAGQAVGVGTLHVSVEADEGEGSEFAAQTYWTYMIPLVIIPGVGVWICGPLFDSSDGGVDELRELLADVLERPESDFHVANIKMSPDGRHRGPDVFETSIFADVAGTLAGRVMPHPDFDRLIDDLLGVGDWVDAKAGFYDDWEIPTWLAETIERRPLD